MRRKTRFYLTLLCLIIFNLKYGLLSLYPDKLLLKPLRDASLLLGDQAILVHSSLFCLGFVTLFSKLAVFYHESRSNIKNIDIMVDWWARKPSYRLSKPHLKTYRFAMSIIYYGYIRIFGVIAMMILSGGTIGLTIVTQIHCDYGNVVILWSWTLLIIFSINQMKIILLSGPLLFYFPIALLNYRFDELIKKLRIAIRRNNGRALYQIMESYDDLISVVNGLNGPFNIIIGLVYCVIPYLIAISVEGIKLDRDELVFKILNKIFLLLFLISNLNAFLINQVSASISVRNKSLPRYLYPIFSSGRNTNKRLKLKIDSFIARLNSQFIGFYCFNLFKFTKMAFYQYAFSISSCYFLLSGFFKN